MALKDYLIRGDLRGIDPDVADLIGYEEARQARRLILIPSEATIPEVVRQTLASSFHNIYAEGYPASDTRHMTQADILDYEMRLAEYRRLSDERYYKGTEYADILEALARRRAAEVFATADIPANKLWVNVQPLSGAPANNAVYSALVKPGETVMGMDLLHGGHLSHGSPVNRSGLNYNIVGYKVDEVSERLDYDQIFALAQKHKPKLIITGFTSYPYIPDWARFREIADAVGAYLLADIAHIAGLVAAKVVPSPVGYAHVISFTTHKSLNGPRGAVLITADKSLAERLDRAVFPGEQGGPHMNAIAALAVALKIAQGDQFRELQTQTVHNAQRLAAQLAGHGLRIPYGGTDSHMLLVDCRSVVNGGDPYLTGDLAARILDLAGIVCNRNTIPGDKSAFRATAVRLGTPWITQRGFKAPEVDRLAAIIADLLKATRPYKYLGRNNTVQREAKADFDVLQQTTMQIRDLAAEAGIDVPGPEKISYPHLYYLDDLPAESGVVLELYGPDVDAFVQWALTNDSSQLKEGDTQPTCLLNPDGSCISPGLLERVNGEVYRLHVARNAGRAAAWLRALSDGFAPLDPGDVYATMPGPVVARVVTGADNLASGKEDGYLADKAAFIGVHGSRYAGPRAEALEPYTWAEPQEAPLQRTPLYDLHKALGAKTVPFAGWDMPVWYSSVSEEHLAVRKAAGLFDVAHMGVWDLKGEGAGEFLNAVTTNDVRALKPNRAHYSYLLGTNGVPIDDIFIYRFAPDHFMIVVNASNDDKDFAWVSGLVQGKWMIDPANPGAKAPGRDRVTLRNLRDRSVDDAMRVDLALQGPQSLDILLSLEATEGDKSRLSKLPWAGIAHVALGGFDVIVTRTGYTGERVAFELFVHPDRAADFFKLLVERGAAPCGLAARDSLRTEAGLPLYGHELAGPLNLTPSEAGFANYVKLDKPFFVGKSGYIAREEARDAMVTRFRMDSKGVRPPQQGDPVVDQRGRVVGIVTSCSIDSEGFQLGQVYLKNDARKVGAKVAIYSGAARLTLRKPFGELQLGDKAPIPDSATILSRFPQE